MRWSCQHAAGCEASEHSVRVPPVGSSWCAQYAKAFHSSKHAPQWIAAVLALLFGEAGRVLPVAALRLARGHHFPAATGGLRFDSTPRSTLQQRRAQVLQAQVTGSRSTPRQPRVTSGADRWVYLLEGLPGHRPGQEGSRAFAAGVVDAEGLNRSGHGCHGNDRQQDQGRGAATTDHCRVRLQSKQSRSRSGGGAVGGSGRGS